jgi:calpain-5
MGLFSSPTPYKGQKYAELKKKAIETGHPFIDTEFPPDNKSLFTTSSKGAGIEWKRPKDICQDPKLFVEGASSNDVTQGSLGNCWFVAACSALAGNKEIWTKVIPDYHEQDWDSEHPEKYAGIFHFQFWRYGEWIDVVVDDFLPVRGTQLVFVHSKSRNEFWSALLEKAYAKLFGCYEALDGGELAEALEDFTGGVAEPIDLVDGQFSIDEDKRDDLFKTMKKEMDNRALMAAAIPAKSSEEMETSIDVGLVKGHAYGITAVKRIALEGTGIFNLFNKEKLPMVRLRNPWGGTEWNGPFSDGSQEWEKIDKASRDKIGLTFDDDGEFWMTMEDYCKYFTNMSICRVVNTSFFSLQKKWHESVMHGEWSSPNCSGGCINNRDTFLNNPQFKFEVPSEEEEVLIELTQKSTRTSCDDNKLTIGFTVMKVEENRSYRCHKIQEVVKSSVFKNSRSIFLRHIFKRGRYVIVACTFEPGPSLNNIIRIYSGAVTHARELTLEKPGKSFFQSICCCFWCCREPKLVTQIKVIKAVGLEIQDKVGGSKTDCADPYCIISCERERITSSVVSDNLNPEWNVSAIYYRKNPVNKPIKINIWNNNVMRDQFMGRCEISTTDEMENKVMELDLYGRKKDERSQKRPGKLYVAITTSRNLTAL